MVFAARVAEGAKGSDDCPALAPTAKTDLDAYLKPFAIDGDGIPW
jgi:hypothetical protein